MKEKSQCVVVASGQCSADWLARLLPPRWFGGDVELLYDPRTRDMRPAVVDWQGRFSERGIN